LEHEKDSSSTPQKPASPLGLLGILALSFGAWFLSKFSDSKHESSSTQHPQDNTHPAQQLGKDISAPVHVVIDTLPSPFVERETREKDGNARDKKRFRWEKGTTVFLAVYTVITFFMWLATKHAADAAKNAAKTAADTLAWNHEQFRIDERPYITTDPHGAYLLPGDKDTVFEFHTISKVHTMGIAVRMKDVGRTAAIDVVSTRTVFIADNFEEATKNAKDFVPDYENTTQGSFLAPNNESVIITPKDLTLTQTQWEQFTKMEYAVYIVGGIRYRDLFDPKLPVPYETVYCYRILPPPSLSFGTCAFTNSIK
jgi:hypothetical protein